MNFSRKLPLLISFLASMHLAFSNWTPEVREYAKTFSTSYHDGYLSSLAATCHLKKISYSDMKVPIERWKIFTPLVETGYVNADVGLQKNDENKTIKAPLAIYIPGSFVNLNEKQANRWLDALTGLGYHTVVFPNPFSLDYLNQVPLAKFGNLQEDAKTLYGAIRNLHDLLRRRQILNGTVRLIGVSSGGFFSAIISALDAEHRSPIISKDTTIVAPGFHMGRGMDRLDKVVDEYRHEYQEMSLVRMLFKLRRICRLEDPSNPSQQILDDGKGIVSFAGFYEELVGSVTRYDEIHQLGKVPGGGKELQRWRDGFKFSAYYDQFNPDGKEALYTKEGHLYHWLAKAYQAGFPAVRILTAEDDFFNDDRVWGSMATNPLLQDMNGQYGVMNDPQMWSKIQNDIIVLSEGGHYGFRTKPWFDGFIQAAFGLSSFNTKRWLHFKELFTESESGELQTDSLLQPLK